MLAFCKKVENILNTLTSGYQEACVFKKIVKIGRVAAEIYSSMKKSQGMQ